jgi:membrane protein implicated in regulation of membrane protease activity
MAWLTDNLSILLIIIGIALLAVEVGVFGFSVFLLFFVGLACIVTGIMMQFLIPATLTWGLVMVAVLSVTFAVVLWKPLHQMQNSSGNNTAVKNDLVGHSFVLERDIAAGGHGKLRMSGVDWKVRSDAPLKAGAHVQVVKVDVGELTIAPASAKAPA